MVSCRSSEKVGVGRRVMGSAGFWSEGAECGERLVLDLTAIVNLPCANHGWLLLTTHFCKCRA